jgi:CRISPR-associated protein Csx10
VRFTVTANLLQDVSPNSNREVGYRSKVEPYIPGSALRGALATAWIRNNGYPVASNIKQGEFVEMFERHVRFGYLFAPNQSVVPLSALLCKYQPYTECRTFSIDQAAETTAEIARQVCPSCDGPLELSKGDATVDTRSYRTRTALGPDERALENNLFARQVIQKGEGWTGEIHSTGSVSSQQLLANELANLNNSMVVLGGSRSTLGRTNIGTAESEDVTVAKRTDGLVLFRLVAPGIFLDQFGRPSLELPLDELAPLLGEAPTALRVTKSWVRPITVGGWHAASGLPKPSDWACALGSTWLVSGIPGDADLVLLQNSALGFRQNEGNGSFQVNPVFNPSKTPTSSVATDSRTVSVDEVLLSLDVREQRWLIGQLKSARVHLETTGRVQEVRLPVRVRQYTHEQEEATVKVLESDNVRILSHTINVLNGQLP